MPLPVRRAVAPPRLMSPVPALPPLPLVPLTQAPVWLSVCSRRRWHVGCSPHIHAASRPTRVKEGRAQNRSSRTRQTDTQGSGGERAGADTRRVDTIDAAACHHPPLRVRERERGQQQPSPWTATAPGGGGCCHSTAPARRQELCVWAVRRGCCRRRLQTDSHTQVPE